MKQMVQTLYASKERPAVRAILFTGQAKSMVQWF